MISESNFLYYLNPMAFKSNVEEFKLSTFTDKSFI